MNLKAFNFKRLAAFAFLALCVAAGATTNAAADDVGLGGNTTPDWTLPSWYPGNPTNTTVGGQDPDVFKLTAPVCGNGWYWDSNQRFYAKRCHFLKYHRVWGGYGSYADYLTGEGLAYYYYWNGKTYCWGSRERPYSWTVWPTNSWTAAFCPQFA